MHCNGFDFVICDDDDNNDDDDDNERGAEA